MRLNGPAALALAALLIACSRPAPERTVTSAPVCRVGPDGGPVDGRVADKGIGGTGAPAFSEQGIGGTGGQALADRGIGGTGIVAVITGFGSICLAGQEVAMPDGTPIVLEGKTASADALRVGNVAVVDADRSAGGLSARRVAVRFEVSGPVDAIAGERLVVAGQDVRLTAGTAGKVPAVGEWVAVSGLRRTDGAVEATRLTPRAPGPVELHGALIHENGVFRIGTQVLTPLPTLPTLVGRDVVVRGTLLLGEVQTETALPDLLVSDPAAFFGPSIATVLFEGYGELGADRLRLGPGLAVPIVGRITAGRLGVYRLERGPNGLRAVGGPGDPSGPRDGYDGVHRPDPHRGFSPAPMPDRSLGADRPGVSPGRPDGSIAPGGGPVPRGGPAPGGPPSGRGR